MNQSSTQTSETDTSRQEDNACAILGPCADDGGQETANSSSSLETSGRWLETAPTYAQLCIEVKRLQAELLKVKSESEVTIKNLQRTIDITEQKRVERNAKLTKIGNQLRDEVRNIISCILNQNKTCRCSENSLNSQRFRDNLAKLKYKMDELKGSTRYLLDFSTLILQKLNTKLTDGMGSAATESQFREMGSHHQPSLKQRDPPTATTLQDDLQIHGNSAVVTLQGVTTENRHPQTGLLPSKQFRFESMAKTQQFAVTLQAQQPPISFTNQALSHTSLGNVGFLDDIGLSSRASAILQDMARGDLTSWKGLGDTGNPQSNNRYDVDKIFGILSSDQSGPSTSTVVREEPSHILVPKTENLENEEHWDEGNTTSAVQEGLLSEMGDMTAAETTGTNTEKSSQFPSNLQIDENDKF